MKTQSATLGVSLAAGLAVLATNARAQWTAVSLHPTGAFYSIANGGCSGFGGIQVGRADVSGAARAGLWSGTAASFVSLHPAGADQSIAFAASGGPNGQQVGRVELPAGGRASLWSGTAASWVNLHPTGAVNSEAWGVDNNVQVGWITPTGPLSAHAAMWTGSAASFVDIHPANWDSSYAYGVHGSQVVGAVITTLGNSRACIWRLPDLLWTDLSPLGGLVSVAYSTDGSHQAGSFYTPGPTGVLHACTWFGSAGSYVDLHPPGAFDSEALFTADGVQAGYFRAGGVGHAAIWTGSAASIVDLHTFLPAAYSSSKATCVWTDGGFTFVSGVASNEVTSQTEAVLWKRATPQTCYANCDNSTAPPVLNANDFQCFLNAFAAGDSAANCDGSTSPPVLNANDFQCFLNKFAAGCS